MAVGKSCNGAHATPFWLIEKIRISISTYRKPTEEAVWWPVELVDAKGLGVSTEQGEYANTNTYMHAHTNVWE